MFTLIDVLLREHLSMRELLSVMQEEVETPGRPDYALMGEILHYCESYPDAYHHPKEDLIYRAVCDRAPDVAAGIEDLEAEHMIMGSAAQEIRRLVKAAAGGDGEAEDSLGQKVGAYLRFYRMHMRREEREVFPVALEHLSKEDWLELETQVVNPTDPYFAEKAAARLQELLGRPKA
ncbi:MAG: hemerythrin domain-containing protein [Rhodospirillales bacterium]